ncbi:exported hypothetical protein [Methylocella tundrae]|uniref:Uncharacterized protein n=1 Tax=Methylocella tundrae TaxID=227605 RepID=A0A8B6M442_METTU|nr:hypothetical protein [Methylocella tundrae]VTZ28007.1 exported hypothetical protein [Methylocella tundrae]VTZ49070.1 exported hypothetical protein [Methylocella tundrae]
MNMISKTVLAGALFGLCLAGGASASARESGYPWGSPIAAGSVSPNGSLGPVAAPSLFHGRSVATDARHEYQRRAEMGSRR